jgi:hypothetical protein
LNSADAYSYITGLIAWRGSKRIPVKIASSQGAFMRVAAKRAGGNNDIEAKFGAKAVLKT